MLRHQIQSVDCDTPSFWQARGLKSGSVRPSINLLKGRLRSAVVDQPSTGAELVADVFDVALSSEAYRH